MKNIIAISGSLRKDSYNTKVLEEIKKMIDKEVSFEILDISKVPLFNQDIENNENKDIINIKNKIKKADLVVISTPEYNYSFSGVLKNTLDWLSRGEDLVFLDKKVALISASASRFGGVRAQNHLRDVLLCMGANTLYKPEVYIAFAHNVFVDNTINDPRVKKQIINFKDNLLKEIN